MPIISAPGAAGTSGANTLLSTTTLGADGTFDISGISQAYNDLLIQAIVRGTTAAASDNLVLRLNNDSGANYDSQSVIGAGASALAGRTAATATPGLAGIAAASAPAGNFGIAQIVIPGYASTTWSKVAISTTGRTDTTAQPTVQVVMVQWRSTAAINRIGFFGLATANLLAGSQVRIYGVL